MFVKISLFLINSYIARLLVGIIAIGIISTGALVSLSECQHFDSRNSNESCNCTNFTVWKDAVDDPDPDSVACQFPQVRCVGV